MVAVTNLGEAGVGNRAPVKVLDQPAGWADW